jgi:hypothetical protein
MSTGEQSAPAGRENITGTPPPEAGDKGTQPLTGIQPDAAAAERIPLPPVPAKTPVSDEAILRRIARLETILLFLVLAFAFVTAAFRAYNPDLFLHLATGRLIAGGAYEFGKDPFTFTAEGTWINHNWLFDLVAFLLYRLGDVGAVILVAGKAVLLTLVAWLMLETSTPPGRPRWIGVLCILVAVLAVSRSAFLQPPVAAFVVLAAILFILVRSEPGSRWVWLLPALCAVWVNVDGWFFLGPLTIALFLGGELLQQHGVGTPWKEHAPGPSPGGSSANTAERSGRSPGLLGLVLLCSVAACLLNPYHVRAFTLPPALQPSVVGSKIARDPAFHHQFLSPLEGAYFARGIGLSAAGLAVFPLALLGAISFALTFARSTTSPSESGGQPGIGWHWWRVFMWLAFLVLAGWNARAIPFFAIVAGPITALNFLDFAEARFGPGVALGHGLRRWAVSGRVLTVVIFIGLIGVAVPGWLQAQPHYSRRVGFGVAVDPALRDTALAVAEWHHEGLLTGEEKWFNTAPEVVNYFAWFCADDRGRPLIHAFIDQRLPLFRAAGEDFMTTQRALLGEDRPAELKPGQEPPPPAWRRILAKREVRYVAVHSDMARSLPMLDRMYGNPDEWQPCSVKGRAAVFAWRDPEEGKKNPFDRRLAVDFNALAFGPDAERAPDERARSAIELPWWRDILEREPASSADAMSAVQHFARFNALEPRFTRRNYLNWRGIIAAGLIGSAGVRGGPVLSGMLLPLRFNLTFAGRPSGEPKPEDRFSVGCLSIYMEQQDGGPPASLYLAIRAARRAIRANPEENRSYLTLANAYSALARRTRERSRTRLGREAPLMPQVEVIRQTQVVSALRSLLALKPRPQVAQLAHLLLAEAFYQPQYLEARVAHLRDYLRLSRSLKSLPGVPAEEFRERLDQVAKDIQNVERSLQNRRDQYQVTAHTKPLLQKARLALENGLAETALDLLLKADPKDLEDKRLPGERPGATMAVDLLLGLGRLDEARAALTPEDTSEGSLSKSVFGTHPQLGLPAYEWFQTQLAAACGDYEAADEALADSIEQLRHTNLDPLLAQLDILPFAPQGKEQDKDDAGRFAGLLVGHMLLSAAQEATRRPWQILRHVPYRLHPPHTPKRPGLEALLFQGTQLLMLLYQQQADLWTVRAWLALEHGRIDRVRDFTSKAFALADLGRGAVKGTKQILLFRSRPLASLCLDLITPRKTEDALKSAD